MTAASHRPRIAITMGDPAGIGPEICLRLLASPRIAEMCTPIVFGDAAILARVAQRLGLPTPTLVENAMTTPGVLDLQALDNPAIVEPGIVNAATGLAAFRYIE